MALYHKHRPQTFESVVGQEHIIKTITNQILTNKVSHAYLFCGPRGIGKTTTARLLAKAMNCRERKPNSFEPCDTCNSCQEISKSRAIDVIEIDAASNTGVDNVRTNIIDNAQFQPTKSVYKIFIIDEVHMLSTSAFNALLKVMEEPPKHVMFILATTELHKLPETIVSRCQRFDFKRLSYDQMKKHLKYIAKDEGVVLEQEVLDRIIRKSDGCARDAVSLLDQLLATGEKTITLDIASLILPTSHIEHNVEFISALVEYKAESALNILNTIVEQDADMVHFAIETVELMRTLMIMKVTNHNESLTADFSGETKKLLEHLMGQIEHASLVRLIDLIIKRKTEIRNAPLPQLPLEIAVVEWCFNNEQHHVAHNTYQGANDEKVKTSQKQPVEDQPKKLDTPNEIRTESHVEEHSNTDTKTSLKPSKTELETPEESSAPSTSALPLTLEEALLKWNAFISAIEQTSPSLVFILKGAELLDVENNTVRLGVEFSFHQDKLMNNKAKFDLEDKLSKIYERPVKLNVVVKEASTTPQKSNDLDDLAAALGGEVVA